MMEDKYFIKISPENLKSDIATKTLSGVTFGVYSAMTQVLTGNGGNSLLTDLTIPICLKQTYDDLGYYTPFDGLILQKDVVTNFIVSADTNNPYKIIIVNTSDKLKNFLKISSYKLEWGDGYTQTWGYSAGDTFEHEYYTVEDTYKITLTQINPWGNTKVVKTIKIPFDGNSTTTTTFSNNQTTINGEYFYSLDENNTIEGQTSDNFTQIPFTITGYTSSKLNELKLYGPIKFSPSVMVKKRGEDYGIVNEITDMYTAYTINNVQYYDYKDNTTIFFIESSGLTSNMIEELPITKEEVLLGVVSSPEIQSNIFIERGKKSAFEGLQRLGEVDNIGDLTSYGYGFFKINKI